MPRVQGLPSALVAETNAALGEQIASQLKRSGFLVLAIKTPADMGKALTEREYDLIVIGGYIQDVERAPRILKTLQRRSPDAYVVAITDPTTWSKLSTSVSGIDHLPYPVEEEHVDGVITRFVEAQQNGPS